MYTTHYDHDFYAWANEQVALLRAGSLSQIDIENIAEEIAGMGRSEKRELIHRLAVLLMHLLKWQFQPALRSKSWQSTIKVQRRDLARHLADNPSLRSIITEAIYEAYGNAVITAAGETDLDEETFPETCPYTFSQMMDAGFWP
ncbi:DUF29 domain-containing protein [Gammaproteobacteria bacterium]